ncbi:MAG: DUF2755 family protein [Citrobacter freundii]|nr:DUF2755 family protein [Citrobacter freundii]
MLSKKPKSRNNLYLKLPSFCTLSKSLFKGKHRDPSSLPGNIAYAVFVLFCFWAGAQILNLLAHAPGIYEQLMQLQMQETGRPRVEIGLGVGTLFGLVPFLAGSLILGAIAAFARWRRRHHNDD